MNWNSRLTDMIVICRSGHVKLRIQNGAQPSRKSAPGGGKGCGNPTSDKPTGVPGKQQRSCKHNPFSALSMATKQSAKAVKQRPPPIDNNRNDPDYDYEKDHKWARRENLEEYQRGSGKTARWWPPAVPLKKKPGSKSAFAVPLKGLTNLGQAWWHFMRLEGTREAQSYCVGSSVWPSLSERSHKISRQISISRHQHCWQYRKPWRPGWCIWWRTWTSAWYMQRESPSIQRHVTGASYQSQQWCRFVFGSSLESLNCTFNVQSLCICLYYVNLS